MSLLKLSINVTAPRQWTLQQTVTDAYMTYEKAFGQRVQFETLSGDDSPWPEYPQSSVADRSNWASSRAAGPITGTITRTRHPDENNYPIAGGSGTLESNPAGIEGWQLAEHPHLRGRRRELREVPNRGAIAMKSNPTAPAAVATRCSN